MAYTNIPRVMDLRGTYKGGGGPDKTVLNSAARHDPSQVHVLVTYLRQPDDHEFQISEMARKLGIKDYIEVFDRSLLDMRCLKQLKQIIVENALQVVHAHDDKTLLYAWILRFMLPSIKIMYTCHSHSDYSRADFPGVQKFLAYKARQRIQIFLMHRFLKPILTISDDTKKRLVANGLVEKDVAVLHNGIDIDVWQRANARPCLKEELGVAPDEYLVGTVARITYDKDLPTFYKVAAEVVKRNPKVIFVIVGDGYGDELLKAKEEVAGLGLEGVVRFTGHRTDLRDVYASFDLFLMTSLTEGMPNTLLEAMALGVPSVSTAVGGVPELIVDGVSGFLASTGDALGLAEIVVRLLDNSQLRASCALACRERIAAEFSFERRVRKMEAYYAMFNGNSAVSCNRI